LADRIASTASPSSAGGSSRSYPFVLGPAVATRARGSRERALDRLAEAPRFWVFGACKNPAGIANSCRRIKEIREPGNTLSGGSSVAQN
jgi:hypothetical protein